MPSALKTMRQPIKGSCTRSFRSR